MMQPDPTMAPGVDPYGDMDDTPPSMTQGIMQGLKRLSPEEIQELDRAITPRVAAILVKMLGPEIQPLLQPLIANDTPMRNIQMPEGPL